jgi:alpha-L-arabinofuranosidase
MIEARVALNLSRVIGDADPLIFGQYLEHVSPDERCIYGAVLDEGSPLSDERGLRLDVIDAVRELGAPVVRWPGGCFADIYHWEDGIGPVDQRPVRRNWHWGGLESNRFGTDEFLGWCRAVGTQPYINFNLGTGTLNDAIRWLDYCNGSDPTSDVLRRQQNGQIEPYNVPFWGVGNEQWGAWEAGQMDAREYAAKLRNWTQFLRKLDPSARFLGIGSNAADDPDWDFEVLRSAGHLIDYLTVHMYGHTLRDDASDDEYYAVVSNAHFFEERLRRIRSVIAAATDQIDRPRPIAISLDEWNIRHMLRDPQTGAVTLDRQSPRTLRDALFVAGVFHAMLRLAPDVGMGCYVFLLNGNAVLRVEDDGIVKTPVYDVFRAYRQLLFPTVLDAQVTTGDFWTGVRQNRIDVTTLRNVGYVDALATISANRNELAVAIINRHRYDSAQVRIDPDRFAPYGPATIWQLHADDPLAANDRAQPDLIRPHEQTIDWSGNITVKPHSVTIVRAAIDVA